VRPSKLRDALIFLFIAPWVSAAAVLAVDLSGDVQYVDAFIVFAVAVASTLATATLCPRAEQIAGLDTAPMDVGISLRSAIRAMPDGGMILFCRKTRRIEELNSKFARDMGYVLASEIHGKLIDEFISSKCLSDIEETKTDLPEHDVSLNHRDGSRIAAKLSVLLLSEESALMRVSFAGVCQYGKH
jgi:PAS domain-containing protein